MSRYIVDTFHDESKLFEEISSGLRNSGISAQCVLDNFISVDSKKNTSDIIADITGRYIIDNLETDKVYEILKASRCEKDEIEGTVKCFKNDTFNKYSRFRVLKKELKEALSNYGRINVEGLLNFRLREYNHLLYAGTAMAMEDYAATKACEDFLNLLEYYVHMQDNKCETVIVTQSGNDYLITDICGNNVEYDDDDDIFDGMELSPLKSEDILIGRLINIAPEKIIVKADPNKPIIKTLKRIFTDKLNIYAEHTGE